MIKVSVVFAVCETVVNGIVVAGVVVNVVVVGTGVVVAVVVVGFGVVVVVVVVVVGVVVEGEVVGVVVGFRAATQACVDTCKSSLPFPKLMIRRRLFSPN